MSAGVLRTERWGNEEGGTTYTEIVSAGEGLSSWQRYKVIFCIFSHHRSHTHGTFTSDLNRAGMKLLCGFLCNAGSLSWIRLLKAYLVSALHPLKFFPLPRWSLSIHVSLIAKSKNADENLRRDALSWASLVQQGRS